MKSIQNTFLIAGTLASLIVLVVSNQCEPIDEPCKIDKYNSDAENEYALYLRPLSPSSGTLLGETEQDGSSQCKKKVNDAYKSEYKQWGGMMRLAHISLWFA